MGAPSPARHDDRLRANVDAVRARIEAARARSPDAASEVQLVAVTKAVPVDVLDLLPAAGLVHIGENRVAQAQARRPKAPPTLTWHGIGHLQRNKVAAAVSTFDVFHALDSLRLARALAKAAADRPTPWPVHLQVNISGEDQKGGFEPDEALEALREVLRLTSLAPVGWMGMAAAGAEESDLRQTFRTLRRVRDEAVRIGLGDPPPSGLSMGMSNDFETAIEEGATSVRIGRALFRGVSTTGASSGGRTPGQTGGAQA